MQQILTPIQIRARQDNTRVVTPQVILPILRKARPGYQLLTIDGKIVEVPIVKAEFKQDNRSSYLKKLDLKYTQLKKEQLKLEELDRRTVLVANALSPAHYVGEAIRLLSGEVHRPFMEGVINGSGIVSENFELNYPILSQFANFGFDVVVPGLLRYTPKLTMPTPRWYPWLPKNNSRYYRIVGSASSINGDAIANANLTGQLRSHAYMDSFYPILPTNELTLLPKKFEYMMFSKGEPWKGSTNGAGSYGKLNQGQRVIRSKAETPGITWEQSNVDFRHKGHKGIFRPRYEGQLNFVPNENFEYFERGPFGIGWWRRDFTNQAAEAEVAMDLMLQGHTFAPKTQFNLSKGEYLKEPPAEIVISGDTPATSTAISENPVRRYLLKIGVDDTKYTDEQLQYLIDQHEQAVRESLPYTRHVVVDRVNSSDVYEDGLRRGGMSYGTSDDGLTVGMVSRHSDLGLGYRGISEDAYNGGIVVAQEYYNLPGVVSGEHLLSPEITVEHVWPKYVDKKLIGSYGRWHYNKGRDVSKTGEEVKVNNLPIMLLYGTSNNTPIKSTLMFDPRSIVDGHFKIDWSNSNPFMKNGGKI